MTHQDRALSLAENTFGKLPLITVAVKADKYDIGRNLNIILVDIFINGDNHGHVLKIFFKDNDLSQVGYAEIVLDDGYENYSSYELFRDNESTESIESCVRNKFVRRLEQTRFYKTMHKLYEKTKRIEEGLQSYRDLVATLRNYGPQHINKGSGKKYLRSLTSHFKYMEGASGYEEVKEHFESLKS